VGIGSEVVDGDGNKDGRVAALPPTVVEETVAEDFTRHKSPRRRFTIVPLDNSTEYHPPPHCSLIIPVTRSSSLLPSCRNSTLHENESIIFCAVVTFRDFNLLPESKNN